MANVYAFRGASVNDTALSYNIRRKHMSCPTGRTGKILFPVFVPCRISGERAIQFYISFLKRSYFHTNSTIDTSYSINLRIKKSFSIGNHLYAMLRTCFRTHIASAAIRLFFGCY